MRMKHAVVVSVVALVALALGVAALPAQGTAGSRTIYVSAVEYKGGTNVADEAYPPAEEPGTVALAPIGDGYRLKEPDATGRWEVSSYRFEPGFLTVRKGESVTLEIAGINGARHDARIMSPSGVTKKSFVVTRGRLTLVTFTPRTTGIWMLHCDTHVPGMVSQILVTD